MGKFRDNLRKALAEQKVHDALPSVVAARIAELAAIKSARPLHYEDRQAHCNTHTTLLKDSEVVTAQAVVGQLVGVVKYVRPVVLVSEHVVHAQSNTLDVPEPWRAVIIRQGKAI